MQGFSPMVFFRCAKNGNSAAMPMVGKLLSATVVQPLSEACLAVSMATARCWCASRMEVLNEFSAGMGRYSEMLLVIDVGNSNIVLGIYDGSQLVRNWRLSTDKSRTSDEYAVLLHSLFSQADLGF